MMFYKTINKHCSNNNSNSKFNTKPKIQAK